MVYGMAFIVFGIGIATSVQSILTNKTASEQVRVLSASSNSADNEGSSGAPSEEEPKGDYVGTYKVAPSLPRLLTISTIGVKARVLQVGVDANNRLGTPKNIFDTAWYGASSKPGEMGAVLIDGHYSGPNTKGVFSKLNRLKVGDEIGLERGDNKVFTYAVIKTETIPEASVDMSKLLVSASTTMPGLNLITCGGDYDTRSNTFSDRTVVYAVQK
jgi:LPXTG-site transpeptidase (sortase) family protein